MEHADSTQEIWSRTRYASNKVAPSCELVETFDKFKSSGRTANGFFEIYLHRCNAGTVHCMYGAEKVMLFSD
jgi:hypothetical protein